MLNQFVLVRIVASIVYCSVLAVGMWGVILPLRKGVITWRDKYNRKFLFQNGKYPMEGNTLVIHRKDFPREYWTGIAVRIVMVVFALWVGVLIYGKLF